MQRGHQVIEPVAVERWLAGVRHREFVVAPLHWLVSRIRPVLTRERPDLWLEVIPVTYLSTYPALGIRFADGVDGDNLTYEGEDVEPRVQQLVAELMATARLSDFIDFATDQGADGSIINRDIPPTPAR
jgi:hypothetical protein